MAVTVLDYVSRNLKYIIGGKVDKFLLPLEVTWLVAIVGGGR